MDGWPMPLIQDQNSIPVDQLASRGGREFIRANRENAPPEPIQDPEPVRKEYNFNQSVTHDPGERGFPLFYSRGILKCAGIYGDYISKVLNDAAENSTQYGEEVDLRLLGPWEISPSFDELGQRAGKDFDWAALADKTHPNNTEWIMRYADLLKPRLLQEPNKQASTFERPPERQLRWDCASNPYMNGSRENPLKIVDLLLFAYEFDQLELRLYELEPVVDAFIILETSKSLKKWDKPLMLGSVLNSPRFRRFRHKIVYTVMDDSSFSRYDKLKRRKLEQYEYALVRRDNETEPCGYGEIYPFEEGESELYVEGESGPYGEGESELHGDEDGTDGLRAWSGIHSDENIQQTRAVLENREKKFSGRWREKKRARAIRTCKKIRRHKREGKYDLEEFARALVFEKYKEQFNDTMNDNVFLIHGDLDELPSAEQVAAFKYCQPEVDEFPVSLTTRFIAQNFAWTRSDGVEMHDSPHVFNESSMTRHKDTGLLQPVRYPGAWVIDVPNIGAHMSSFMSPECEVFKFLSYTDAGKLPRSDFDKHTAATLARHPEMGYVWKVCGVRTCTPEDPYLTRFINYDTWIPWFADVNRERYPFLFPSSKVLQICEYVRDQQVDNREAFDRALSFAYSRGIRP
ncbi:Beta-1,4-mannosyl-glycoprotein 4-beta-N-acetylglucosaminyltransferase [Perkinsus chesapeaki]|uniref:Beta-1,4-mannosyl-glycoprotein 4-beta-N-acetylglucosaminyltransferase n=1 Tax=Perkinsus chesapeaki TaxID=330153 RepID=A0A7J6L1P9_PERCH|nr:Beta-1,4-mannosyl-glycoprotein 4-beta-N-acetylglucosaminyltransferase [Perkinsus chesapeaki]